MGKGVIKGSRTLDLLAISVVLDAAAMGFLAYAPEQLGLTVPAYMMFRIVITALQAYLRFRTVGPVGGNTDAN